VLAPWTSSGAVRREGYRATRGFAGNAFGHRLDVSSRRVRAVRALGRTAPRDARRGFSTSPSGFLAEGPARCARVTGGVCDAARHPDALSDSTDVHGIPGTRVVRVAMPRAVHHARQTATRRRSRVFRVSPVCEAREKSHHASAGRIGIPTPQLAAPVHSFDPPSERITQTTTQR
jgi:hypothetical protein